MARDRSRIGVFGAGSRVFRLFSGKSKKSSARGRTGVLLGVIEVHVL